MKISRRDLLARAAVGTTAAGVATANAQGQSGHEGHTMPEKNAAAPPAPPHHATPPPRTNTTRRSHVPVRTLNGWTLPWKINGGWKEFHLVAEEFEHEFAPGCKAKVWGYNGSTPGPTIEAVEGDRVRIFVTNRLQEPTSVHWHGILLPNGMDGVGGLTQPQIKPGETFVYEFTLRQHGSHMYHPHVDEMVQMALGMMGMFIIHPRNGEETPVDRDYCFMLHNWALHPGTYRPDPSIMTDFDLWTFNSKVFPAIDPLVARTGERVRMRIGNLSMWNHPIHLHGVEYFVTGSDAGRWPRHQWRREVTEIIGVGQMRDIEFIAPAGDWALHCHMTHHVMNSMGHELVSNIGVDQSGVTEKIRELLPGYMAMGKNGMSEHQEHVDAGHMQGPENTLPMMWGDGPFGNLEMGGMFTVLKVRDDLEPGDYRDPGWYRHPKGTVARRVSADPNFGSPPRRPGAGTSGPMSKPPPPHAEGDNSQDHSTMDHSQMDHAKPR